MNNVNVADKIQTLSVSSSSEGLWQRFRDGDRDALGIIYDLYIDDLFHYGMHFCGDREKVKDSLQDLFQSLWYDREHLSHDVSNIRYYLLSSLRRRILRSLTKERRYQKNISVLFDFQLVPPEEESIVKDEIYHEHAAQLKQDIAKLSRRQREAVYLHFYQNLSYHEVANLMTMKVESVYNLVSKAIGLLKKMVLIFLLIQFI